MKPSILLVAFLTACGTVNTLPGADDDSGNGSGSDLGPPHPPGMLYGSVHDERGDAIDFSSGEPVHAHAGAMIDLSTGCPAVYKYAYLMTEHDPVFGRQTTRNPLAWHVTTDVASLDASATAYRVRADDGSVLLDWTQAAPDPSGLYTIELVRDGDHGIAVLGTRTGKMYVDIRFRDVAGNETVDSACWEHHPLAAPLEVQPLEAADLFQMSLPASSPLSPLINPSGLNLGYGIDVVSERIVQHAGEPVTIGMTIPKPTGLATGTLVDAYVVSGVSTALVACGDSPCGTSTFAPTYTPVSMPLAGRWITRIVDETSGAVVCDSQGSIAIDTTDLTCTLPARGASEPPHAYRVVLALGDAGAFAPPFTHGLERYGDFTVGTTSYTGTSPIANAGASCTHEQVKNTPLGPVFTCTSTTTYARIGAIDTARIDFDPIAIQLATAPAPDAAREPYATSSVGALTWDAGSEGL